MLFGGPELLHLSPLHSRFSSAERRLALSFHILQLPISDECSTHSLHSHESTYFNQVTIQQRPHLIIPKRADSHLARRPVYKLCPSFCLDFQDLSSFSKMRRRPDPQQSGVPDRVHKLVCGRFVYQPLFGMMWWGDC